MRGSRFARFAWAVLAYNLAVILWGAYVRATGSGAGCGNHWPLCDGKVIPHPKQVEMLIEFTHRGSAALGILLSVVLFVWAFRAFPKGSLVRLGASLTLFFTFSEALVGAGLVLFKLVAHNASVYRAVAISTHLLNTFVLLACLAMTAWWASGGGAIRLRNQGAVAWALAAGLLGALLLGMGGAVTALGDTLFPPGSLAEGIRQDFTPTASFLLRMRPLHPLIATSVGVYLFLIAGLIAYLRPSPRTRALAHWIIVLFLAQMVLGLMNMALLAPIGMQLAHLLLADAVWVSLVLLAASALDVGSPRTELGGHARRNTGSSPAGGGTATWQGYVALTKPRVISLLLFTTLTAMVVAAHGWPGTVLFLAVAVGGYMAAGAANTINMVIDQDIDGRMKRTSTRPTVTHAISSQNALLFALGLAAGSFVILSAAANVLAAVLAQAGLAFYVIVYTLLLKRRTWHNIVIGGAAGAFPPLVGWAAVTGNLSPLAWILFALIFVWTPVHFWALAILIKDDYAEAGVPMAPVVLGERATVVQIGLYALLTAALSVVPLTLREVGWGYLAAVLLLNLTLLGRSLQLLQHPGRPRALSLYKYSMLYLALLFLAMAVDRAMHLPVV